MQPWVWTGVGQTWVSVGFRGAFEFGRKGVGYDRRRVAVIVPYTGTYLNNIELELMLLSFLQMHLLPFPCYEWSVSF